MKLKKTKSSKSWAKVTVKGLQGSQPCNSWGAKSKRASKTGANRGRARRKKMTEEGHPART